MNNINENSQKQTMQNRPPETPKLGEDTGQLHPDPKESMSGNNKRPISYKQALNSNVVKRKFFTTHKNNTVRVDFTDFRSDVHKAREYFGEFFSEDIQPRNYKKHSKYPIYEIQFHTEIEARIVFQANLDFNGHRIHVQKGISNEMILQNVRIRDVPVDYYNVKSIKEVIKDWFADFGQVLEVTNNKNEQEKLNFWRCPDSNFHLQLALPKNFWDIGKDIPNTIDILNTTCDIDWYGRNYFCYHCKKEGHIKRKCPNKGKRTRFNEPKRNSLSLDTTETLPIENINNENAKEIHTNSIKNSLLIGNIDDTHNETNIAENVSTLNPVHENVAQNDFVSVTEMCKGATLKGLRCTKPVRRNNVNDSIYCRLHKKELAKSQSLIKKR